MVLWLFDTPFSLSLLLDMRGRTVAEDQGGLIPIIVQSDAIQCMERGSQSAMKVRLME